MNSMYIYKGEAAACEQQAAVPLYDVMDEAMHQAAEAETASSVQILKILNNPSGF